MVDGSSRFWRPRALQILPVTVEAGGRRPGLLPVGARDRLSDLEQIASQDDLSPEVRFRGRQPCALRGGIVVGHVVGQYQGLHTSFGGNPADVFDRRMAFENVL